MAQQQWQVRTRVIQYGAVELKAIYQKYWLTAWGSPWRSTSAWSDRIIWCGLLQAEEPPTCHVRILKYSDLGPPPSIAAANTPPPISVSAPWPSRQSVRRSRCPTRR